MFVEPMPPTGEVYRASGQLNGDVPAWSRDGRELFFASSSRLYAVPVQPGSPRVHAVLLAVRDASKRPPAVPAPSVDDPMVAWVQVNLHPPLGVKMS